MYNKFPSISRSIIFDRVQLYCTLANVLKICKGTRRLLIFSHSIVGRLRHDLLSHFDAQAAINVNLQGTAEIYMHRVGGSTVLKLRKFDMGVISKIFPDIVILEIGTNNLSNIPFLKSWVLILRISLHN